MALVFLDKISANAHIESVVATKEIGYGQWLKLGVLAEDGEARVATAATSVDDADVLVALDPISYGLPEPYFKLADYKLPAGKLGRAYHMVKGDVISVTKDLVADADNVKDGDALTMGDNGVGFKKEASGKGIAMVIGHEDHGIDGEVVVIAIR